jgi:hypothetical protein
MGDTGTQHARKSADLRLVVVLWRDAHADGDSWISVDDIEDCPYIVESVGFVLESVKAGHISLCQSLAADEGIVDHVIHIPNEMIVEVTDLPLRCDTVTDDSE